MAREELTALFRAARRLSNDERVVLASRLGVLGDCAEVCATYGWSRDKYRKLAQRGRGRLRRLGADVSVTDGGSE